MPKTPQFQSLNCEDLLLFYVLHEVSVYWSLEALVLVLYHSFYITINRIFWYCRCLIRLKQANLRCYLVLQETVIASSFAIFSQIFFFTLFFLHYRAQIIRELSNVRNSQCDHRLLRWKFSDVDLHVKQRHKFAHVIL